MRIGQFFIMFGIMAATLATGSRRARADIYQLANGGELRGELVNRDDSARRTFVIHTFDGATVTLERSQVKQIVSQTPADLEYEKIRPTFADTAADQLRLAEWCKEKSLTRARQAALERVLELDPENRQARMGLGYSQIDGRWVQPDQLMQERGYVRYKGRWLLPQEVELEEQRHKSEMAEKQWFTNLKRWRGWLDEPGKVAQVREEVGSIDDPLAVAALAQTLKTEPRQEMRVWCLQALGRIKTPDAIKVIVDQSLRDDNEEEIRLTCFDVLTGDAARIAVPQYVGALKDKDNAIVNRAGYALGKLGDKSAILPLIDALVTTHKFIVMEGSGNPGQTSAGFSPSGAGGPGGFTFGGPKQVTIKRDLNNQQVLDALTNLTGLNLGFDQRAWRNWYASQKKSPTVGTSRD